MKKYKLIKDAEIFYKNSDRIILKGTEVLSDGSLDEHGGINTIIDSGKYKGLKITFAQEELKKIKD